MNLIARLSRVDFLRFGAVGAAGYVVDNAVLYVMTHIVGGDYYSSRIVSVLAAMTFTWFGNRMLTFRHASARGARNIALEWMRFVGANAIGALVNFGLYAVLLTYAASPWNNPYLALPLGVLAGMVFNFFLSKHFVFGARQA